MSDERIPLAEIIGELRSELFEAAKEGKGHPVRFRVDEAEVELEVAVSKEVKAGGGVKFWVYNTDVEGKLASKQTQRIRLKLVSVGSDGKKRLISSDRELPPNESVESE